MSQNLSHHIVSQPKDARPLGPRTRSCLTHCFLFCLLRSGLLLTKRLVEGDGDVLDGSRWKRAAARAQGQLPLLHLLLGYTGKRGGASVPFGKRSTLGWGSYGLSDQDFEDLQDSDEKRGLEEAPLLHQGFMSGKREYQPLLHSIPGKRSWNYLPVQWNKIKKHDFGYMYGYEPLLHQQGFGKRDKETMEQTLDESRRYGLEGRASDVADPPPYYDETFRDIETRGVNNYDASKKWREFSRKFPLTLGRKRRGIQEYPEEQSDVFDLDLMSDTEEKRMVPLLHQMSGKRSDGLKWDMFGNIRSKKSPFDMFTKIRNKKNPLDMFHRIRTRNPPFDLEEYKRSTPLLHEMGAFGKRGAGVGGAEESQERDVNVGKRDGPRIRFGKREDGEIDLNAENGISGVGLVKKSVPLLHQMPMFPKKSVPLLHRLQAVDPNMPQ